MARFYSCRYVVDQAASSDSKRLCLAATVDGRHCKNHVGMEVAKLPRVKILAAREEAVVSKYERKEHWPFWP